MKIETQILPHRWWWGRSSKGTNRK